ncbi:MAG: hypothetical protein K9G70_11010 [Prolixibacteraceae bacterium]|nr:hypothetical protein [Prolixibacteraceae bacterium]
MKKRNLLLVALFIVTIFACKKDPDIYGGDKHELIIAEQTKVISETDRSLIMNIDTTTFTFTIEKGSNIGSDLKIGDILVDGVSEFASSGYLRKVTKIEEFDDKLIIKTEQAKLWEAVPQASIRFESGSLEKSMLKSCVLADGVTFSNENSSELKSSNFNAFNYDVDKTLGGINVSGSVGLDMEFIFNFDWGVDFDLDFIRVDLFKTSIAIDQNSNIKVEGVEGAELTGPFPIATLYFTPLTYSLGLIPVVLVPTVEIILEVDGTVSAELRTSASESYHGELGIKYTSDNGWDGIGESDADYDFNPPSLISNTNFKTYLGPEVKILLYGLAGPTINLLGFCELDASLASNDNWNLDFYVGVKSEAGVEMDLIGFDLDYNTTIFDVKTNIYSLNNEPLGSSISIAEPTHNSNHSKGNPLFIKATVIGEKPSEVQFFIDNNLEYTDITEPYEFAWDTGNSTEGNHIIVVREIINEEVVSEDEVTISLQNANWTAIDLTQYGVGENAVLYQVLFIDSENGWIAGTQNAYGPDFDAEDGDGFILITHDGGDSWEMYNSLIFKDLVATNSNTLFGRFGSGVYSSYSAGRGFSEKSLLYCPGDVPIGDCEPAETFPFSVHNISMNWKGEVVAIGRSLTNDNSLKITSARASDNDPVSIYTNEKYSIVHGENAQLRFKNHFGIAFNLGIKGTNDPIYLTSPDDGVTWTEHQATFQTMVGRDTYANDVCFWDENIGWIVGGYVMENESYIAKTTNGGESFSKINLWDYGIRVSGGDTPQAVNFISEQEGYIGYGSSISENLTNEADFKMYHTKDGGTTWSPVESIISKDGINDIFFLGSSFGWAVGNRSIIYKYTPG